MKTAGSASSLLRSLRLGPLTGKLVEVNLIMGIIKLALVVLAMVFSAIPTALRIGHGGSAALYLVGASSASLYLVASDFFQVARLVAFVQFWRSIRRSPGEHTPLAQHRIRRQVN